MELEHERVFSKLGIVVRGAELASFTEKKYLHVNMSSGVLNFKTKPEDFHNIDLPQNGKHIFTLVTALNALS